MPKQKDEYCVNGVNLQKRDWRLLRRVADARAEQAGGRRSVSKVLESLIEARRQQLEREAAIPIRVVEDDSSIMPSPNPD